MVNGTAQCTVTRKYHATFWVLDISGAPKQGVSAGWHRQATVPRGSRTYMEARDRWLVKPIRTTRKDWTEPVRL